MDLTNNKVYKTLIFKTTYIYVARNNGKTSVLIHVLVMLYGLYTTEVDIA